MEYLEAKFNISCPKGMMDVARDVLAAIAGDAGFESFTETETGLDGYVQTTLLDRCALDTAIAAFPLDGTTIEYEIAEVESRDWNEEWEQTGFRGITVTTECEMWHQLRTLSIVPATTPDPACSDASLGGKSPLPAPGSIVLSPRMAFGTGSHETTRMILHFLLTTDLRGMRVLDCGCGTGILGIAASKLGADSVCSYDIDEWSVENTVYNASLNAIGNLKAVKGDVSVLEKVDETDEFGISGDFDLILANINRNILLQDMPTMCRRMHRGSRLILSGFYTDDLPMITNKARALGMEFSSKQSDDNWCCAEFIKK